MISTFSQARFILFLRSISEGLEAGSGPEKGQ
jgi:hypothetical protein